ncbi:MAG: stage II sporulation protein M [Gammaproteobacteria bacterium]|nr:stage II sporulation protein M [Gammaproteobacteria bacterium]
MSQARFVQRHASDWRRLRSLLDGKADDGPPSTDVPAAAGAERAPPSQRPTERPSRRFPSLDRSPLASGVSLELAELHGRLVVQLAIARERGYASDLVEELNELLLRTHARVHAVPPPAPRNMLRWLLEVYPSRVRAQYPHLIAALLLFFAPMLLVGVATIHDPELVHTLLDPIEVMAYERMYDPDNTRRYGQAARDSGTDFLAFGFYLRNNTSIGFQTFVGGLLLGLGTVFYLVYNGLHIGAVLGYVTAIGHGEPLWSFIAGHSALELSAIVLSGAAGTRLGWALIAPGRRTRLRALHEAARDGVQLIYGASALFVLAAFVEAYWSSMVLVPAFAKYLSGIGLWLLLIVYLRRGGRSEMSPRPQVDDGGRRS